jgi:hypothetical protein
MTTKKQFKFWIIVNWRTGKLSLFKRKMKNYKYDQIPIAVDLEIAIPDNPQPLSLIGKIELSEAKVNELALAELTRGIGDNPVNEVP